jgi:dUTP pyrophosphatase
MDIKLNIVNKSRHLLPQYQTALSAGMDIRANLEQPVTIKSFERTAIATGLFVSLPQGYEIQIRPRSGLAINHGITVLNAPGTIDADYRGEIKVILINLSGDDFVINDGDRIAQMVVSCHEHSEWIEVEMLDETERGVGGFGHTGK